MSDTHDLTSSLGYRLSLAARVQQRRMEAGLKPLGLSRTQWAILASVGLDGLSRPSDIADHLAIDRTATSRALRRMEADGLIARVDGKGDGRTRRVALTETGQARLDAATPVARAVSRGIAEQLTSGEAEALRRILTKLSAESGEDRPTHL